MNSVTRHKMLIGTLLLCGASFVMAQEPDPPAPHRETGILLNVSLGFQRWPALQELDTRPFGTFDDSGMNLSGSAHVPWKVNSRRELLLGLDLGAMVHESNITAPGDIGTVDTDVFYIAPSLRWSFLTSRRLRWNLEAGAGAYLAEMREYIDIGYDFIEGTRHFKSWAPGGFVGASVDLDVGRPGRWSISTGGRVHFADFGDVDVFGNNAGALDGPITTLQIGFTYDWKGD